jgi:cyclopropane-fatty-acyl-phospholipid synthase
MNESQPEALRHRLLDRALIAGAVPDGMLRAGSLYGAWARERRESAGGVDACSERLRALIARMSTGAIAEQVGVANEQHYELPASFMALVLGPRMKYSGCLWPAGVASLAAAEDAMLSLTCARAGVTDGMRVLDLGCGWGSLTLWLAERYPGGCVVGVSYSASQRAWIVAEAKRRGLGNVSIATADVNSFSPSGTFDRVISIEMFEHMRNWRELLRRVATWLAPDGRAFAHVFSHRTLTYLFEGTWAASRFFTSGLMPSHELLLHFADDLRVTDSWIVPGTHYARTLSAWLERLDAAIASGEALEVLIRSGRSDAEARRLLATWRLFFISTNVIWGYRGGDRWLVSHYLLAPRR